MPENKNISNNLKIIDIESRVPTMANVDSKPGQSCYCTNDEMAQLNLPRMEQPFIEGTIKTPIGEVPRVSSSLTWKDKWGSIKARWNVGRMEFKVDPGLYALGNPDKESPVLVSANYKMSFDRLRHALPDQNIWILVLDTDGINVWCAAGKGTFGTEELVRRIKFICLDKIVSHSELILPQLGAPGVSAHQVKKLSGFKIIYGPILAKDIQAFLDSGKKTTKEMRRKSFPMWERIVLIPVELITALKWSLLLSLAFFLLSGFGGPVAYWTNVLDHGSFAVIAIMLGLVAGTALTPLLLPWLPGRAFAFKGLVIGLVLMAIAVFFRIQYLSTLPGRLEILAWFFIMPAISAYLAMNFTGCSTYTSLSGVKKEIRWAVPMEITAGVIGIALWVGSRIIY